MAFSPDMIRRATAAPYERFSRADGERIIEIACLAVLSDGQIAPEEMKVLEIVGEAAKLSDDEVEALVRKVVKVGDREQRLERLRQVADSVSDEAARQAAYKVTVLVAMADLAASDEEFEFDLDVQDALRLSTQDAERLAGEVHEAVTPDEP